MGSNFGYECDGYYAIQPVLEDDRLEESDVVLIAAGRLLRAMLEFQLHPSYSRMS